MAKSKTLRSTRYSFNSMLLVAIIFGVVGGIISWAAFAAPHNSGGSAGTGSLSVKMVTDNNGDGLPNWNDTITFDVKSSSSTPFVQVECYQGGSLVYSAWAGFYDSYLWPGSRNMPLTSPTWTSGAADCKAYLNPRTQGKKTVADYTLSFHVNA